jgi:UDP-N-acetylenolpyruvoylglucosamine reductase
MIIGNGTRILRPDGLVNAMVIILNSGHWTSLNWLGDNALHCARGVSFHDLYKSVNEKQYLGIARLSYIPVYLGGVIFMKARSHGQTISGHLISIDFLNPNGRTHIMEKASLDFGSLGVFHSM